MSILSVEVWIQRMKKNESSWSLCFKLRWIHQILSLGKANASSSWQVHRKCREKKLQGGNYLIINKGRNTLVEVKYEILQLCRVIVSIGKWEKKPRR